MKRSDMAYALSLESDEHEARLPIDISFASTARCDPSAAEEALDSVAKGAAAVVLAATSPSTLPLTIDAQEQNVRRSQVVCFARSFKPYLASSYLEEELLDDCCHYPRHSGIMHEGCGVSCRAPH